MRDGNHPSDVTSKTRDNGQFVIQKSQESFYLGRVASGFFVLRGNFLENKQLRQGIDSRLLTF